MSEFRMRPSVRVITGLLIAGSALLAACSTPAPLPDANPKATAVTKEVTPATATSEATTETTEVSPAAATSNSQSRYDRGFGLPLRPQSPLRIARVMDFATSTVASPNGRWVAEMTVATPKTGDRYYTNLTVTDVARTSRWTVVDEWAQYGLGYTLPRPFHWSRDGRYLYVTNEPVPDGCALFVNGPDLQRVDLSNGKVTQIVEPVGLWLSLSPDETTLAYLSWAEGRPLVVRDLANGAENEVKLPASDPNWQAGNIVWSQDGDKLALTIANNPCSGELGPVHLDRTGRPDNV